MNSLSPLFFHFFIFSSHQQISESEAIQNPTMANPGGAADADDGYKAFLSVLEAPPGGERQLLDATKAGGAAKGTTDGGDPTPTQAQGKKKASDSSDGGEEEDDKYEGTKPAPFLSLFRHGSFEDKVIMFLGVVLQSCVGFSFAAMNLVFGEMIDDLSAPTGSVLDATSSTIRVMLILAAVFGAAAFVAMSFLPWGAARITQRVRSEYVAAVLRQDMAFFDESKPGEVVAALSDYTLDFEEGLSVKLGEGLQGTCGAVGGLVVALYFSWQITVSRRMGGVCQLVV